MSSWKRTYWAVWSANLITAIGMMSFLPFFPSLLEDMGLTGEREVAVWSGLVFGAAPLSATFMSPVWGALGDRVGRKVMVIRAMFAIALFVGAMAFATSPLQLFLLRIGQGLFSGFIPPSITLVSVGAPPERQGRVAGDLTTALALGAIIGPGLGGFVAAASEHRHVFLLVGALAVVAGLLVWAFAQEDASHRQKSAGPASAGAVLAGVWSDVGEVWGNRNVRAMVVLVFFLQFGLGSTNPTLELYVRDLLKDKESVIWSALSGLLPAASDGDELARLAFATSLLFTGMAICNLVSLPLWGRFGDRGGHRRALVLCAAGSAVALFIQAAAPLYTVLFLGRMLMGAAMAGTGPLAFGMAAAEVAVDRRGGAFGVVFSARTLAVAVGGMAGGALSSYVGIRGVMALCGGMVIAAMVAFRRSS